MGKGKGNAQGTKHDRDKAAETFKQTRPCEKCTMRLIDARTTLGHTDKVCKAFKAEKDREDSKKAKRAASLNDRTEFSFTSCSRRSGDASAFIPFPRWPTTTSGGLPAAAGAAIIDSAPARNTDRIYNEATHPPTTPFAQLGQ